MLPNFPVNGYDSKVFDVFVKILSYVTLQDEL